MRSVLIDAPVEDVFSFHEQPDALALLSPKFPPVRVISRSADGIEPGVTLELRIGPFRWVALHTAYEKNRLFEDRQLEGPFAKWTHRHEFEPAGSGTRLTDRVQYELPGGALGELLFGWIAKRGLENMFAHRHRVTQEIFRQRRSCPPRNSADPSD